MTLRALSIRGPDAEHHRQPQRVQTGGFFRPLFGRSKRGHPGLSNDTPPAQSTADTADRSRKDAVHRKGLTSAPASSLHDP